MDKILEALLQTIEVEVAIEHIETMFPLCYRQLDILKVLNEKNR